MLTKKHLFFKNCFMRFAFKVKQNCEALNLFYKISILYQTELVTNAANRSHYLQKSQLSY